MTYLQPLLPILLLWMLVSSFAAWRRGRTSKPLWSSLVLLLLALQPVAWLFLFPLEHPYQAVMPSDRSVDAIVVLSSSVIAPSPPRAEPMLGAGSYERCAYAASLYRNWKAVPVLASGGGSGDTPCSRLMSAELVKSGVPETMIWTEDRSMSTYENAVFSAAILRQKGIRKIALVTEAFHMARAQRCFVKVGIEVVPAPCGFRLEARGRLTELLPTWMAVLENEDSLHEFVGLAWYRLRGWI